MNIRIYYFIALCLLTANAHCFAMEVLTTREISSKSMLIPEPIDPELLKNLDILPQEKLLEIANKIECEQAFSYIQRHVIPPLKTTDFDEPIGFIAWHPTKNMLVADVGNEIVLLDGVTFTKIGHFIRLSGHKNFVIIAEGKYIAEFNDQSTIRITNLETLRPICIFDAGHQEQDLEAIGLSSDQKFFITVGSGDDGKLKIWSFVDLLQGKKTEPVVIQRKAILALATHPNRNIIAINTAEGVEVWNLENRTRITIGSSHFLRFSPNGKHLAAERWESIPTDHDSLYVWDMDNYILQTIPFTNNIMSLCWHPSSKYLATASRDGCLLWSVPAMKKISSLSPQQVTLNQDLMELADLSWSFDGTQLAIGNIQKTLRVLDTSYLTKLEKIIFDDRKFNGKELVQLRRIFYYLSQIIDINTRRAIRKQSLLIFKITEKDDIDLFQKLPTYIKDALYPLVMVV